MTEEHNETLARLQHSITSVDAAQAKFMRKQKYEIKMKNRKKKKRTQCIANCTTVEVVMQLRETNAQLLVNSAMPAKKESF